MEIGFHEKTDSFCKRSKSWHRPIAIILASGGTQLKGSRACGVRNKNHLKLQKKTPQITRKLQIARLIFSAHQQHVGQGEAGKKKHSVKGALALNGH